MATVSVQEEQARLGELIQELGPGEVLTITEGDRQVARLVGVPDVARPQPLPGRCRGLLTILSDDEEHLNDWGEYMR